MASTRATAYVTRTLSAALLLLSSALAPACEAESPADPEPGDASTCGATWPDAPAGATALTYVAASCAGGEEDGSESQPWSSVSAALASAAAGTVVLIADGVYAESVELTVEDVVLLGTGPDVVVAPPQGQVGVKAVAAQGVRLEALAISEATGVGAWAHGGSLTLRDVRVVGTRVDAAGEDPLGYGVLAADGAVVTIELSEVSGSEGVGVLASSATLVVSATMVSDNDGGGVRLQAGADGSIVQTSDIVGNGGFGVAAVDATVSILDSSIAGQLNDAPFDPGDGVVIVTTSDDDGDPVAYGEICHTTILGNARAGVVISGAGTLAMVDDCEIADNDLGGAWVQDGAGSEGAVTLEGSLLSGNTLSALIVRSGASVHAAGNTLTGTIEGFVFEGVDSAEMGEGAAVLAGASATLDGNTVEANARAGILLDGVSADAPTTIQGNQVHDNEHGIVLQNVVGAPELSDNTLSGNATGDDPVTLGPDDTPLSAVSENLELDALVAALPP